MELKRTDTFTDNETTVITIQNFIQRIMGSLNLFLERLQEKKPEVYTEYLERFKHKLKFLTSESSPNFDSIQNLSEIERLYLAYVHQILEIPDGHSSQAIEITWHTHDRSIYYPAYYRTQVLCEILGREEGFTYLKNYIDTLIYERTEPNLDIENLDSFWEEEEEEGAHPSYGVGFRMNRGKFGWRVERCVIAEVLEPMKDPDLCHIVICYGDTASFESINPNFAYTMPRTLMQGHQYCEKCFHDKRHVEGVKHPPEEFWESLPSQSELKLK